MPTDAISDIISLSSGIFCACSVVGMICRSCIGVLLTVLEGAGLGVERIGNRASYLSCCTAAGAVAPKTNTGEVD